MSDFSTLPYRVAKGRGELTSHIKSIYYTDPPDVFEYHGDFGVKGL